MNSFIPNIYKTPVQNKNNTQAVCNNLAPLKSDTVSFGWNWKWRSPQPQPTYSRKGEGIEQHYKDTGLEKNIYKAIPLLKENKTFGLDEYNKLNEKEKDILRRVTFNNYSNLCDNNDSNGFDKKIVERSIQEDAMFLTKVADSLKFKLDKQYPQGYKFVSIGGSPSILSKILEYQGVNTMIVPYSKSLATQGVKDVDYKKYFNEIGLADYMKNSDKKIIFTDYVCHSWSTTLDFFKTDLILSKLYTKDNRDNIEFEPLKKLVNTPLLSNDEIKFYEDYYLTDYATKDFSPCPKMNEKKCYEEATTMKDTFDWNISTKLINFVIIDYLIEKGKLTV